jgi:hypothetical protein
MKSCPSVSAPDRAGERHGGRVPDHAGRDPGDVQPLCQGDRFYEFFCHHNMCEPATRDRCSDFLNIFAEKFSKKIGVFDVKQC